MMAAQKLTLMKNQILEYDRYVGMNRKYGAVKINALKNLPVTVSIYSILFKIIIYYSDICRLSLLKKMKKRKKDRSLFRIRLGI